ncbi:photosynthetic complex putative assembly protein PuhB [Actibacterium sp. 188UL27-1]|uniref:photosynthetic complex putative assembly protein PuhB n=1 Tax=Actibacterium sp. 188UL27-1 TaxID=2786961 RepID=UPI001959C781|nr:photosynthetic complex putative assembly protein PuhB [Actibacterium sp. 188UL27-1]MBM7068597.1 PH domain-containing protein [Actibacterium sp. 188UL27-1]
MPHDTHDDFAFEHAPGLPARLPKGEHMLWQGKPDAWQLAVDSLLLRWVIGYFAFLIIWRVGSAFADHSVGVAFGSAVPLLIMGAVAGGILYGFSWVQARATVYTVTTERVLLRVGAALQLTLNMPYKQLENAALDLRGNGTGTIALEPKKDGGQMVSYLVMWPHVRPWRMAKPEPALRCIKDAENVASILADAAEAHMTMPRVARAPQPAIETDMPAGAIPAE